MRVVFFTEHRLRHPARLLLRVLAPMLLHTLQQGWLTATLAAVTLAWLAPSPPPLDLIVAAAAPLLVLMLIALVATAHELAHAAAGARLVDTAYPQALVMPTFQHPYLRFAAGRADVAPARAVVILLAGPAFGLGAAFALLPAVILLPDPLDLRWAAWGVWTAVLISQATSLAPFGDTDMSKALQLMTSERATWRETRLVARELFFGRHRAGE